MSYPNLTQDNLKAPETNEIGVPIARHDILENDGLAAVSREVNAGDVYINKVTPEQAHATGIIGSDTGQPAKYLPSAMTYKPSDPSYIGKIMLTANEGETKLVKVITRQIRRPEVGNKFSFRHG